MTVVTSAFQKVPFSPVHTNAPPLWRVGFQKAVFLVFENIISVWAQDLSLDKKKVAFSNLSGLVWTGPKLSVTHGTALYCHQS